MKINKQQFDQYISIVNLGGFNKLCPRSRHQNFITLSRREYMFIHYNINQLSKIYKL